MRASLRWALWAVGCFALAGCTDPSLESGRPSGTPARQMGLIAKARPPVLDIPVPIGFELVESQSRNRSGGGIRWIDHVYVGNAEKFEVVRFYRRHMEQHGWKEMSYQFAQGRGLFSYEKDVAGYKEECTVVVQDASWDRVQVIVGVGPRGAATVPAE